MPTVAGQSLALRRMSQAIADKVVKEAVRLLEDKVIELDRRLADAERRLAAGGL